MNAAGLIVCYLVLVGAALRRLWIACNARRAAQARTLCPLRFDDHATIMVPIRNEPAVARAAAKWWSEHTGVDPCFVVTDAEQPSKTKEALGAAGARHIIVTDGRTKAEMLAQALGAVSDDVSRVWIFDSDSRPVGDFTCRGCIGVAPCIYVPDCAVSGRFFSIWAGIALWQSVWSYGFELSMSKARNLWYLVGHGVGLERKQFMDFDRMQRCEDLALGYKLSALQIEVCPVGGSDVALWPTRPGVHVNQIARWFIGDLQAVASQRPFTIRHALRLIELIAGWWLGVPLCLACWLHARSWHPGWADGALALVVLSLPAPIVVVATLCPVGARSGVGVLIGLLIRPLIDCVACTIGVWKLVVGTSPVTDRLVTLKGGDALTARTPA